MEIDSSKEIYVVKTNSDLTEGRGRTIILAYTDGLTTARRLASRKGVQGMDAHIDIDTAYHIDGRWHGSIIIHQPTEEDIKKDTELSKVELAKAKALKAGLTEEEIQLLSQ